MHIYLFSIHSFVLFQKISIYTPSTEGFFDLNSPYPELLWKTNLVPYLTLKPQAFETHPLGISNGHLWSGVLRMFLGQHIVLEQVIG